MSIPRKLQKRLVIETVSGRTIVLQEPQILWTKRQIWDRIAQSAPEAIRRKLKKPWEQW